MSEREPISRVPPWIWPILAMTLCAGAGMIAAVFVLLVQCNEWLKTGEWNPLSAAWAWDAVGLHLPVTKMVGAERIVEWCVWVASPAPLAVTALIAGFLPVVVLLLLANWIAALRTDIANNRAERAARKARSKNSESRDR